MTGLLPMRSLWWYVASHAVMVIAIAVALYHYPQLPDPLPLHWGQDGTVDNAAPKTIPTVLFLVGLGPAIVIAAGGPVLLDTLSSSHTTAEKEMQCLVSGRF